VPCPESEVASLLHTRSEFLVKRPVREVQPKRWHSVYAGAKVRKLVMSPSVPLPLKMVSGDDDPAMPLPLFEDSLSLFRCLDFLPILYDDTKVPALPPTSSFWGKRFNNKIRNIRVSLRARSPNSTLQKIDLFLEALAVYHLTSTTTTMCTRRRPTILSY